eukprot:TRINITY_DN5060_c0_g1_i1.p1 TRINITY_DN5060_c0_g1~~TRINITY_DN5060_c0_g1_i1.p1  ORF type:complete len:267 (+),score=65.04 TRINITY_DN5060_c0_g1_i1:165-965(+)
MPTRLLRTWSQEGKDSPYSLPALVAVFLAAIALLSLTFYNFPVMQKEDRELITLPSSFEDVQIIGQVLSKYTEHHYVAVMCGFSVVYIFLQTFSIPGSIFLSSLAGALFGLYIGVPLVCLLSSIGASTSYMLSFYLGKGLVWKFFPDKLKFFADELDKRRNNLLNYVLFLRFTPFIPNWFVNIASPLVGIPLSTFFIGTFFGVMPQTFAAVNAGLSLQEIQSPRDLIDIKMFLSLFGLALLSLLPTLPPVQRRLDRLLNRQEGKRE